ncbi:hypothetical protein TSAR_005254 [Trichomalopsis sarcophagae]|uniref:Uncharacterized protein n=1 Tax=Trichomalopsis sarcophagae TaxID=543379 RepID=A0A232F7Y0_9HYME|nr:hypothetical protein TSAR_005254 [Trichomalopsis sarcophagae]
MSPEMTKHNEAWIENSSSDIIQEKLSQHKDPTMAEVEDIFEANEIRVKQLCKKIKRLESQLQECSYQKDILLEKYRRFSEQQDQIHNNFQRYINNMEYTTPSNGRINQYIFASDQNQYRHPPTGNNNTKVFLSNFLSCNRDRKQCRMVHRHDDHLIKLNHIIPNIKPMRIIHHKSSHRLRYIAIDFIRSAHRVYLFTESVAAPVNGYGDTRNAHWTNPQTTHQMSQPISSYYPGPPYAQNNPGSTVPLSQPLAIVTDQSQLGGYQTYVLAPLTPQMQTNSGVQQFAGPVAYYYEPTVVQNRAPNIEYQHRHVSS